MARRKKYYKVNYKSSKVYKVAKLSYLIAAWITIKSFKLCKKIYYKIKYQEEKYTKEYLKNLLKEIDHRQFEVFCCELYKALGYSATITSATHDGGVDVILKRYGVTTFVECKHYAENNMIGREICQKLLGSCVMNKADKAIIFTTGGINRNAKECKRKVNHLEIIDFNGIFDLFNNLSSSKQNTVIVNTVSYV